MIWMPDGNVLVALVVKDHAHHQQAVNWLGGIIERFATCSVTQGTLLRMHILYAKNGSAEAAWKALADIEAHPLHDYLADDLPYREVPNHQLQGHRQVTDAWLVELARRNAGKVATLDQALLATYPNDAVLI